MDEKTLRTLVHVGAIKRVRIVADGNRFHIEADTPNNTVVLLTGRGTPRTWSTLDASARWVRSLGMGSVQLDLSRWQPGQRALRL